MTINETLQLRMSLERIITQRNQAVFILRKAENGEAIGKMYIYHRKIVDQTQKMGSEGSITNPRREHFPERIVIKGQKP